ncbi:MAG: hypothetical protein J0L75_03325 [Spirochaetes bacterium]|nr:hypothetical protein [Spirochaetota bacterium]
MKTWRLLPILALLLAPLFADTSLPLPNPGFESGLSGWDNAGDNGMSLASPSAKESGAVGLRVTDASDRSGSSLTSAKFPAKPGATYRARCRARIVSGSGIAVYLFYLDAAGKLLNSGKNLKELSSSTPGWQDVECAATAPAGSASVAVNIHSYGKAIVTADFDSFSLVEVGGPALVPSKTAPAPQAGFGPLRSDIKGRPFDFSNGDFEKDMEGWDVEGDGDMSKAVPEAARAGRLGLRITDDNPKGGSSIASPKFPVTPGKEYRVRCYSRMVGGGGGIGLYVQFFEENGKPIEQNPPDMMGLPSGKDWKKVDYGTYAPEKAATWRIWIHSYNSAKVTQDVDDLVLYEGDGSQTERPWAPQYRLRPEEKARLTAADLVGPDGIVYPDFRRAGVPGGIPELPVKVDLTGKIKPGSDISAVLEREADALGRSGGGVLFIPAGNYRLESDVLITNHHVVLRGAGTNKTRLRYTYAVPHGTVKFYRLKPGDSFNIVEIHANPLDLKNLILEADGKEVGRKNWQVHWGNTYSMRVGRSAIFDKVGAGRHTITGKAVYANGEVASASIELNVASAPIEPPTILPSQSGAISFAGAIDGAKILLAKDGARGDLSLTLADASSFRPGDRLELEAPATPRWNDLIKNVCAWGRYRVNQYEVLSVSGNTVQLSQALRLEFPVVDGAYVRKILPLEGGGIEDLSIEQTENLWINTVSFSRTWGSWARRVHVRMAGKNPVYFLDSKFGEIRDCVFDDAWYKGGGGTAYAGVEVSYDCLLDGLVTYGFRHAPDFNWACSGNVVRRGRFYSSDAQWHSGWCNENLFEDCIIQPDGQDGDYGFGFFSTAPEDDAHGPIGPRNVIYRCDFKSPKDGGILNGMNEGWLVLHNRFVVEKGVGLSLRLSSFDHLIQGNVFVFPNGADSAVLIKDASCVGNEVISNRAFGAKAMVGGRGKAEKETGNELLPYDDAPRPAPAVPSIYEWQKKTYPLK